MVTRKSISGWVVFFAIAVFVLIISCSPSKGQIQGNVIAKIVYAKSGLPRVDSLLKPQKTEFKDRKVLLLKHSAGLSERCEMLVREDELLTREKMRKFLEQAVAAMMSGERTLVDAITNNASQFATQRNAELERKINELVFPLVVQEAAISDNGDFRFEDIPYGEYYIHLHKGSFTWFVPIALKSKESNVKLNESNSFQRMAY